MKSQGTAWHRVVVTPDDDNEDRARDLVRGTLDLDLDELDDETEVTKQAESGRRRRRVRTGPRPKVYARRDLKRAVNAERGAVIPDATFDARPKVRGDCARGCRPCPWVACKYHLYLSVKPDSGTIVINFPDLQPWELKETCALDVADRGGITLEEVGEIANLTRERIRQIEVRGLLKLRDQGIDLRGER